MYIHVYIYMYVYECVYILRGSCVVPLELPERGTNYLQGKCFEFSIQKLSNLLSSGL